MWGARRCWQWQEGVGEGPIRQAALGALPTALQLQAVDSVQAATLVGGAPTRAPLGPQGEEWMSVQLHPLQALACCSSPLREAAVAVLASALLSPMQRPLEALAGLQGEAAVPGPTTMEEGGAVASLVAAAATAAAPTCPLGEAEAAPL